MKHACWKGFSAFSVVFTYSGIVFKAECNMLCFMFDVMSKTVFLTWICIHNTIHRQHLQTPWLFSSLAFTLNYIFVRIIYFLYSCCYFWLGNYFKKLSRLTHSCSLWLDSLPVFKPMYAFTQFRFIAVTTNSTLRCSLHYALLVLQAISAVWLLCWWFRTVPG